MFNFLKNKDKEELNKKNINYFALELMISFALADGNISKQEESNILDYINKKIAENDNKKIYSDILSASLEIISLHDQVQEINNHYNNEEKLELLKDIWLLILSDQVIDKYEENLFYRIGDLMKIKRSKLNQIKSSYGLDK
jgi:uncharacterized tellurite resistance protein B-like protein|tara:strand:- start:244 stop:666 length:423 start_codon:yes stop_codon:yes gene_type:complete